MARGCGQRPGPRLATRGAAGRGGASQGCDAEPPSPAPAPSTATWPCRRPRRQGSLRPNPSAAALGAASDGAGSLALVVSAEARPLAEFQGWAIGGSEGGEDRWRATIGQMMPPSHWAPVGLHSRRSGPSPASQGQEKLQGYHLGPWRFGGWKGERGGVDERERPAKRRKRREGGERSRGREEKTRKPGQDGGKTAHVEGSRTANGRRSAAAATRVTALASPNRGKMKRELQAEEAGDLMSDNPFRAQACGWRQSCCCSGFFVGAALHLHAKCSAAPSAAGSKEHSAGEVPVSQRERVGKELRQWVHATWTLEKGFPTRMRHTVREMWQWLVDEPLYLLRCHDVPPRPA